MCCIIYFPLALLVDSLPSSYIFPTLLLFLSIFDMISDGMLGTWATIDSLAPFPRNDLPQRPCGACEAFLWIRKQILKRWEVNRLTMGKTHGFSPSLNLALTRLWHALFFAGTWATTTSVLAFLGSGRPCLDWGPYECPIVDIWEWLQLETSTTCLLFTVLCLQVPE